MAPSAYAAGGPSYLLAAEMHAATRFAEVDAGRRTEIQIWGRNKTTKMVYGQTRPALQHFTLVVSAAAKGPRLAPFGGPPITCFSFVVQEGSANA